ncbi:hypothetical protein BV25DRAFT_1823015 [Artomyces pyxidatus]|uniref:Uncharacterized protein n=1 Tax=Artomyces pyxidatus TaxID=48021 RepID=A0ACB8T7Z7_9AGAM|nr:hypothetical protein BV25DRAFT_1823015 [Artomyces pyxidatus]
MPVQLLTVEEEPIALQSPDEDWEDDYDVYLFWPSLNAEESPAKLVFPMYGPISPDASDEEGDPYGALEHLPQSPLSSASTSNFRFPDPSTGEGEQKADTLPVPQYSKVVKMGLFLSATRCIDRLFGMVKGVWQSKAK